MASPSRQTSCEQCVRAKRRCDLSTPQCSRCFNRSLTCTYKNEPLTAPMMSFENMQSSNFPLNFNFDLFSSLNLANSQAPGNALSSSSLSTQLLRWSSTQTKDSTAWVINHLKSYPRMFVLSGHTPFIHSRLYRIHLPRVMQDTFNMCATYQAMTEPNKSIVLGIIETRAQELTQEDMHSFSWSLADNLGYVQAMILVQIILLFDGDIRLRALGEEHHDIFIKWTEQLHWRLNNGLDDPPQQPVQSWVVAESTRRTIIIVHVLQGIYWFCKLGRYDVALATPMCRLQFTAQAPLWDIPSENSFQGSQRLISYAELAQELPISIYLPEFEKLLLVACKGEECSELITSA